MDQVRLYLEGLKQPLTVDLDSYVRIKAEHPTRACRIECPDCGVKAIAHIPKKPQLMSLTGRELTVTEVKRSKKVQPFTHQSANSLCPQNLARDLRLKELYAKNNFDPQVRKKNIEALSKKGMQQALQDIQAFHHLSLTNKPEISQEVRHALYGVTEKLLNLEGLDEHPWILGYALLFADLPRGTLMRDFSDGPYSAEFKTERYQSLPITRLDGTSGSLTIPHFYRAEFRQAKEGRFLPERKKQNSREMTRDKARKIVADARTSRHAGKADAAPLIHSAPQPEGVLKSQPLRPLEPASALSGAGAMPSQRFWWAHEPD
jgi:hypothetical protein